MVIFGSVNPEKICSLVHCDFSWEREIKFRFLKQKPTRMPVFTLSSSITVLQSWTRIKCFHMLYYLIDFRSTVEHCNCIHTCLSEWRLFERYGWMNKIRDDTEQLPSAAKPTGPELHDLVSTISHTLNIVLCTGRDQWPYQRLVHDPITPVWQQASILLVGMHTEASTTRPPPPLQISQSARPPVLQHRWVSLIHPSPNPVGYHREAAVLSTHRCG